VPNGLRRVIRPFQSVTRRFASWNYLAGAPTRMSAGVPDDDATGTVDGPDPFVIVVAGGMAGSGIGLRTFHQGVASQFARGLAASTGRGVEWESVGGSTLKLAASAAELRRMPHLTDADVIVLGLGVADVLAFTPLKRWTTELAELLRHLSAVSRPGAEIIITNVPDVSQWVQVGPLVASLLSDDSRQFGEAAYALTLETPKCTFLALPPVEQTDFVDGAFSYPTLYRRWGRFLAQHVAARQPRPGSEAEQQQA
jgi:hypothetical protein